MRSTFIQITVMAMLIFACSKEDDSQPEENSENPIVTDYFLNSNESWFYEIYIDGVPHGYEGYRQYYYKVLSKDILDTLGKKVVLVTIEEKHVHFGARDTMTKFEEIREFQVFYNHDSLQLRQRNGTIWVDFNDFYKGNPCQIEGKLFTYKKCGSKVYRTFVTSSQTLIDGIDLGVRYCKAYPPTSYEIPVDHRVTRMRYKSDECEFER